MLFSLQFWRQIISIWISSIRVSTRVSTSGGLVRGRFRLFLPCPHRRKRNKTFTYDSFADKGTPRTRTHRLERKFMGFYSDSKQDQRCASFGRYRSLSGWKLTSKSNWHFHFFAYNSQSTIDRKKCFKRKFNGTISAANLP